MVPRPKLRRRRFLRMLRRHRWKVHTHGRFESPHGLIIIHKMPKRKKAKR